MRDTRDRGIQDIANAVGGGWSGTLPRKILLSVQPCCPGADTGHKEFGVSKTMERLHANSGHALAELHNQDRSAWRLRPGHNCLSSAAMSPHSQGSATSRAIRPRSGSAGEGPAGGAGKAVTPNESPAARSLKRARP